VNTVNTVNNCHKTTLNITYVSFPVQEMISNFHWQQ